MTACKRLFAPTLLTWSASIHYPWTLRLRTLLTRMVVALGGLACIAGIRHQNPVPGYFEVLAPPPWLATLYGIGLRPGVIEACALAMLAITGLAIWARQRVRSFEGDAARGRRLMLARRERMARWSVMTQWVGATLVLAMGYAVVLPQAYWVHQLPQRVLEERRQSPEPIAAPAAHPRQAMPVA